MASHAKRKHSLFSPSSGERWSTCPGSVELSRNAPPQKESFFAREGTSAHECKEFIVKRYSDRRGARLEALKKWPLDMVDYAMLSADTLHSPLLRTPGAELLIERRVALKSVKDLYGTVDYAWVDLWGRLTVIDFKYGAGVTVFAKDLDGKPNTQLMIYATAIASEFNYDFESVRIGIIQPRVYAANEEPLSYVDVSIPELKAFERTIAKAVKAALEPNAKLVSGDHCRWCPALATCPENSKKALALAHVDFDLEDGIKSAPDTALLTPKSIPQILDACSKLEMWIKAVRERAHAMAEAGEKIPGYKLVAKRGTRAWSEDAEGLAAQKWKLDAYRLEKHFLSPAQIEKAFGAEGKKFTRDNTHTFSSGSNLVPDTDKRSEIVNVSDFDFS